MSHPPSLSVVPGAPTRSRNGVLAALSPEDWAHIGPMLEPVTLMQGDVLFEPNQPIEHVHCFEAGLSSEVVVSPQGERIEVGCVG